MRGGRDNEEGVQKEQSEEYAVRRREGAKRVRVEREDVVHLDVHDSGSAARAFPDFIASCKTRSTNSISFIWMTL